jgi:hypothetical protein
LRWLPRQLALTRSSIAPLLELGDEEVAWHVISGSARSPYRDVEIVDFWKTFGTRNIMLTFRGRAWTFTANVSSDQDARMALSKLRDKECQLSAAAAEFING